MTSMSNTKSHACLHCQHVRAINLAHPGNKPYPPVPVTPLTQTLYRSTRVYLELGFSSRAPPPLPHTQPVMELRTLSALGLALLMTLENQNCVYNEMPP